MIVYTSKKEKVVLADEPLASGGEGEVRKVTSCPSRFNDVCAKLYFKPKQTKKQEQKIRFMVANPPSIVVGKGMMLAWPLETIHGKNGEFMGFLMPLAFPDSRQLVILTLPKLKKAYKTEWYKFDKELDIRTALISRMKLINNISIPIHSLHATGKYVLKDFKPENVLVTPTGQIAIVDMDSIQICENGKLLFPGTAATPDYMPPEFYNLNVGVDEKKPLDKSWDNFAVSEVFYQLMFGLKPYAVAPKTESDESNTIPYCISHNLFPFGKNTSEIAKIPAPHNNFKIVPKPVQELFIRAFDDNPNNRPQAVEWGKTIHSVLLSIDTGEGTPPKPEPQPKPQPKPQPEPEPGPGPEPVKYCPKCGTSHTVSAQFCKKCGYDFKNSGTKSGCTAPFAAMLVVAFTIFVVIMNVV